MQSCWFEHAHMRPTFKQLVQDLKEYGNEMKGKKILVKPKVKSEDRNIPIVVTPTVSSSRRSSSARPSMLPSKSTSESMQSLLGAAEGISKSLQNSASTLLLKVAEKLSPSSSTSDARSKSPRSSSDNTK